MKALLPLLFVTLSAHSEITKVFRGFEKTEISYEEFLKNLAPTGIVVLGEHHNQASIQSAQAKIIQDHVIQSQRQGQFEIFWEFLNHSDQDKITSQFQAFVDNKITAEEFVSSTAGKQNAGYAPIFEVGKQFGAQIFGMNLPREIKQLVIRDGIDGVDAKWIPPHHYIGGEAYQKRFEAVMKDHIPAEKLDRYFLAQCLTDSSMAYQAAIHHKDLSFLVAGSFHTDFFDATVERLKKLTHAPVTTLKIINTSIMSPEEIQEVVDGDKQYGAYADFIVLTQ